jgi:HSP20 family protein
MAQFPFQIRRLPGALQDFASEMETIVDQVLNNNCGDGTACETDAATSTPALDIYEDESGYDLYLDLPGVSIENVKLELLQDKLHVSGTKGSTSVSEKSVLHRGERTSGKFARAVRLPKQVDADHIQASLKHGVLHVRLPKVPKPSSRQIEIRIAD